MSDDELDSRFAVSEAQSYEGVQTEPVPYPKGYKPELDPFQVCDGLKSWHIPGRKLWPREAIAKLSRNCKLMTEKHNHGEPNEVVVPLFIYSVSLYKRTTWALWIEDENVKPIWRVVPLCKELEDFSNTSVDTPQKIESKLKKVFQKGIEEAMKDRKEVDGRELLPISPPDEIRHRDPASCPWKHLTLFDCLYTGNEKKQGPVTLLARYSIDERDLMENPNRYPLADTVAWLPEYPVMQRSYFKDLPPPEILEYVHSRRQDEELALGSDFSSRPYQWVKPDEVQKLVERCYKAINQQEYVKELYDDLKKVLASDRKVANSIANKKLNEEPMPCEIAETLDLQAITWKGTTYYASLSRAPKVLALENGDAFVISRFFTPYYYQPYYHTNAVLRSLQEGNTETSINISKGKAPVSGVFRARPNTGAGVSLLLKANERPAGFLPEAASVYRALQTTSWLTVLWDSENEHFARWGADNDETSRDDIDKEHVDSLVNPLLGWHIYQYTKTGTVCLTSEPLQHIAFRPGTWLLSQARPLIYYMDFALANLSPVVGKHRTIPDVDASVKCYRGLGGGRLNLKVYQRGGVVLWTPFSSTSKSQGVALDFAAGKKRASVFVTKGRSCRWLALWSRFSREDEWLYPLNSKFVVTSLLTDDQKRILRKEHLQFFELTEAEDKGLQTIPVKQMLADVKNDVEARVVLKAIEAVRGDGVLDLSLAATSLETTQDSDQWQYTHTVKYDGARLCPIVRTNARGMCEARDAVDLRNWALEAMEENGNVLSRTGNDFTLRHKATAVFDHRAASTTDAEVRSLKLLQTVSRILRLQTAEGPEFAEINLTPNSMVIWAQKPSKKWEVQLELTRNKPRPNMSLGDEGCLLLQKILSLGIEVSKIDLRNNNIETLGLQRILRGVRLNKNIKQVIVNDSFEMLQEYKFANKKLFKSYEEIAEHVKNTPGKNCEPDDIELLMYTINIRCLFHKGILNESVLRDFGSCFPVFCSKAVYDVKVIRADFDSLFDKMHDESCWFISLLVEECLRGNVPVPKLPGALVCASRCAKDLSFIKLLLRIGCPRDERDQFGESAYLKLMRRQEMASDPEFGNVLMHLGGIDAGRVYSIRTYPSCCCNMEKAEWELKNFALRAIRKYEKKPFDLLEELQENLKVEPDSRPITMEELGGISLYAGGLALECSELKNSIPFGKSHVTLLLYYLYSFGFRQDMMPAYDKARQGGTGITYPCKPNWTCMNGSCSAGVMSWQDQEAWEIDRESAECKKRNKNGVYVLEKDWLPEDGDWEKAIVDKQTNDVMVQQEIQIASMNLQQPEVFGGRSVLEQSKNRIYKWAKFWGALNSNLILSAESDMVLHRTIVNVPCPIVEYHLRLQTGRIYSSADPTLWAEYDSSMPFRAKPTAGGNVNTLHFIARGLVRATKVTLLCNHRYDVLLPALSTFVVTDVELKGNVVEIGLTARGGLFSTDEELTRWCSKVGQEVDRVEKKLRGVECSSPCNFDRIPHDDTWYSEEGKDKEREGADYDIYYSKAAMYLHKAEREREFADAVNILSNVNEFAKCVIKSDTPQEGYDYKTHRSLDKKRMLPVTLRPAYTFLSLLGRDVHNRKGPGELYYLPSCRLKQCILTQPSGEMIEISAGTMEKVHRNEFSDSKDQLEEYFDLEKGRNWAAYPDLSQLYGRAVFKISKGEIQQLVRSTKIVTSSLLPLAFYKELVGRFTAAKEYAVFFSIFDATPLSVIAEWGDECTKQMDVIRADVVKHERNIESPNVAHFCPAKQTKKAERIRYRNKILLAIKQQYMELINNKEEIARLQAEFASWVKKVREKHYEFHFDSKRHAHLTLGKSLAELATEICISQRGYFFTSGVDGRHNHIAPKSAGRVTFISAAGLNFSSLDSIEAPKFFHKVGTGWKPWKYFKKNKRSELHHRIRTMYEVIFKAAQAQGVRSMNVIPLGLGVSLGSIDNGLHESIAESYFRAQFELLSEQDWGFENYYINPVGKREQAKRILQEGLVRHGAYNNESEGLYLRCNIIFHNKDAKFLASKLAENGKAPSFLNASSSRSLLQGRFGLYWEEGRSWNFTGEEDWAATGTGVLADFSVCGDFLNLPSPDACEP
eukprot:TRINITY_DN17188_c0_g1_i1.p1 TRINITY_DN17188_c0_g1~~TRINITY_DN17188_c0_g1_i1.p1  ORF type:complete len:2100 (+),score=443.57 TRINITY_DN17188_c0_g1_i1:71-6370(+)